MECHNSINLLSETEMEILSLQPSTALGEVDAQAPVDFNKIRILPAMKTTNKVSYSFHFMEVLLTHKIHI